MPAYHHKDFQKYIPESELLYPFLMARASDLAQAYSEVTGAKKGIIEVDLRLAIDKVFHNKSPACAYIFITDGFVDVAHKKGLGVPGL